MTYTFGPTEGGILVVLSSHEWNSIVLLCVVKWYYSHAPGGIAYNYRPVEFCVGGGRAQLFSITKD